MKKIIPEFTGIIDGKQFKKGIEAEYPDYLIKMISMAKDRTGNAAYPFKTVEEIPELPKSNKKTKKGDE